MKKNPAILAAAMIAAFSTGAVQAKPVPGSVLKKYARGVHLAYWKGKKARVQLFANGTLRAWHSNKVDVGRWSIKGNVMCVTFKVWTHNRPKCGTVEDHGAWYVGLKNSKGKPRLKFHK